MGARSCFLESKKGENTMKSIVSYPERGVGGKNGYRGNCSPKLIEDLIRQFGVQFITDYMVGSGTTKDVADQLGIRSFTTDLSQGFDLMAEDLPVRSEMTFWHPPYHDIVIYAGQEYPVAPVREKYGFDPTERDLSQIWDWDAFMRIINACCVKQFSALEQGGRLAILMGDIKKKGRLYSMIKEICCPGTLEQIVIKAQHNCWSERVDYSGRFIPIVHEYLMIVKKETGLVFDVSYPVHQKADMRDLGVASWRDVVLEVIGSLGGEADLSSIYDQINGHKKTRTNPHWREKIRQTLQIHPEIFVSTKRGTWSTAA